MINKETIDAISELIDNINNTESEIDIQNYLKENVEDIGLILKVLKK